MRQFLNKAFVHWSEGRRSPGLLLFGAIAKPVSLLYRVGAACDRRFRYPAPVSRTGNSSLVVVSSPLVGGVGKTPLTAHLATQLHSRLGNTEIVTMGYGRAQAGDATVGPDCDTSVDRVGDEAMMLARSTGLQVHVGDRPESTIARLECDESICCIVLDDGVRRRWVGETRIVVFTDRDMRWPVRFVPDGRWRVPPGYVWPAAGVAIVLRNSPGEPPHSARIEPLLTEYRRTLAGWGYNGPVGIYSLRPDGIISIADPTTTVQPPDAQPYLLSGLGMPSRFVQTVESMGLAPRGHDRFPDHYSYTQDDLVSLQVHARGADSRWILTTHKDAVKINPAWLSDIPVYFLRISLELTGGEDMLSVILGTPK